MKGRLATTAGLVSALLAALPLQAQGTFEGVVTIRASVTAGGPSEMKYYQKGSKIRQEASMGGQTSASILNGATGESIMIMPATRQYMVVNLNEMAKMMPAGRQRAPDLSKMKVTATGRRETIAGVACEHYLFTDTGTPSGGTMDMCGAAGMGFMGVGGRGMGSMPSTSGMASARNPQLVALARRGFFPLKITMTPPAGGATMTWEVTRIERRTLDTSLFAAPAGYTRMTMPAMPGGMPKR